LKVFEDYCCGGDIMYCFPKVKGLSEEFLTAIKTAGIKERKIGKNVVLIREGDKNDKIIILEKGFATVSRTDQNGNGKLLSLAYNEALGLAGFFQGKEYPATVVTLTECRIYELNRPDTMRLIDEVSVIRRCLLEMMDEYVSFYIKNSVYQIYDSIEVQLARLLLDVAQNCGQNRADGDIQIPMALTDEMLSNFFGCSRETITRVLGKWKGEKLVYKKNRNISIHNREELIRLAQGEDDYKI